MRILPKLGLTAATVVASAGLLAPLAGQANASTLCRAPKGGSCQHAVHHAAHHKATHHGNGGHHGRHHEHHKRCHHDHHDDSRDD